jgi:glutamate/tyrosine decarboxylase-like PLP-dependent enzyme
MSTENTEELRDLAQLIVDDCLDYLDVIRKPTSPVSAFKHPDELTAVLKKAAVTLQEDGCTSAELRSNVATIMEETVHTGHQKCINQLFHRADVVSILGDWITATINTSIYTYETAPIVTLMEQEVVNRYQKMLGWETISGTLPPGGSMSNLYGITCARTNRFPRVPMDGWQTEDHPCIFVSDQAHYSSKKSCGLIGIGYNNCIPVKTDFYGRMIPDELEIEIQKAIAAGKNPFCVVSTCGTTLTGAVDPIDGICDVVEKYNKDSRKIWVHVDGALGGGLIHSAKGKLALKGIERADSFSINPHKMLGVTQQCSVFLTKHGKVQCSSFCTNAAYLFNDDKEYDADKYDVGDKVFQCGRRPDCLKLWILWRHRGDKGMEAYIDKAMERHSLFNSILVSPKFHKTFRLMVDEPNPVPCTCFWWVPPTHRDRKDIDTLKLITQPEVAEIINTIVPKAKLKMMEDRAAVVTMSKMPDLPNFWRMVTNGAVRWETEEFEDFLTMVERYCDTFYAEMYPSA